MGPENNACNSSSLCIRRSGNRSGCRTRIGKPGGDPSGRPFGARKDGAGQARPPTAQHGSKPADRQPGPRGAGSAIDFTVAYGDIFKRAHSLTGITDTEIASR